MERIESAHSTWLFDTDRRRFRRLPSGVDPDAFVPDSEWEPYFALDIDESTGGFTVTLDADGTRLLRAFRRSTDDATQEMRIQPGLGAES